MVKNHKWSIHHGSRHIDSGTVEAESERDAMKQVMSRGSELPIEMEKCYRITVGDMVMSSYGDEFTRSAHVVGWGEDVETKSGGYLFRDPLPSGITMDHDIGECPYDFEDNLCNYDQDRQREFDNLLGSCGPPQECHISPTRRHNMNGNVVNPGTGEIHAQCQDCGFIDPKGTGKMHHDPLTDIQRVKGTDSIIGHAVNSAKKRRPRPSLWSTDSMVSDTATPVPTAARPTPSR